MRYPTALEGHNSYWGAAGLNFIFRSGGPTCMLSYFFKSNILTLLRAYRTTCPYNLSSVEQFPGEPPEIHPRPSYIPSSDHNHL